MPTRLLGTGLHPHPQELQLWVKRPPPPQGAPGRPSPRTRFCADSSATPVAGAHRQAVRLRMHPKRGHTRAGELVLTWVLWTLGPDELGPEGAEVREVAVYVLSS